MKRFIIIAGIVIGVIALGVAGSIGLLWTPAQTEKLPTQMAEAALIGTKNNDITPAAGPATVAAAPAPKASPVVMALPPAAKPPVVEKPEVAKTDSEAKEADKEEEKEEKPLSQAEMADIHAQVKEVLARDFKNKLSFPIDENKMIAFVQASQKVKKINSKWDVQIASAEKDEMAMEYNTFSIEEITKSLQSMQGGLTVDQYNDLSKLTASDQKFNQIYQVYAELIKNGVVVVPAPGTTPAPAVPGAAPVSGPATPPLQQIQAAPAGDPPAPLPLPLPEPKTP